MNLVATGEVFDVHGGEGAIGDGEFGACIGTNAGGAQADVFDGSGAIAEAAVVADADNFVGEDGHSAKKIFECLLGGESDGNASDAEASEHGGEVEAEDTERAQNGDDDHQRGEQALGEHHQGSCADAAGADSVDAQALHGEVGDAEQKPKETDADENADGPVVIKT